MKNLQKRLAELEKRMDSMDSFIRAELSERVGDLDYKLDEGEGTIRGYNKRDTDMIELMLLNIDKAKFTGAVNKATILAFGGPDNDSARIAMDKAEKDIKKDCNKDENFGTEIL